MKHSHTSALLKRTTLVTACLLALTAAHAQEAVDDASKEPPKEDAATSKNQLQTVTVTAERRVTTTQKTSQAVSAVSGDDLAKNGIVNAQSLADMVPGLDANQGGGFSQIRIRGVGGGVVNNFGEPGVAYNIGGVYLAQPYGGNSAYYDLNRIEVLKGPQGTLYGRNATAGAINLLPNRPAMKRTEGQISLQLGNYSDREVEGFINFPAGDVAATRIAFSKVKHDGYFSNGQSDADSTAVRGQVLIKPDPKYSLLLMADYFEEGGKAPGDTPLFPGTNFNGLGAIQPGATGRYLDPSNPWKNLGGSFTYSSGFPAPNDTIRPYANPSIDHKQLVTSADFQADLGFATLNIIPAFVTTKVDDHLANYGYTSDVFTDAKQTTLEARLSSNSEGPLQWVGGLYYFDQKNNSTQTFFQRGLGYITLGTPKLDATSYAAFGQTTLKVAEGTRLLAGLRYTQEDKTVNGATVAPGVPAFLCPNFVPATGTGYGISDRCSVPNVGSLSFKATNWKLGAEYDVAKDSMLYANVSTGFRAGGFNPGSPPNTFNPEKLTAYEAGWKNELLDRRLRLNVSAYYWDYSVESNPVFGPINPIGFAFVVQPASSHISGIELESAAKITADDRVTLNVLYQRGVYDKYSTLPIPLLGIPATVYDGHTRPNSPTWSGTLNYDHSFNLSTGASIDVNLGVHFESSSILSLASPSPDGYTRPGFATENVSLAYYSPDEKFVLTTFVRNVSNKFVPTSVFQSTTTGNVFQQGQAPRTFGVSATVNF